MYKKSHAFSKQLIGLLDWKPIYALKLVNQIGTYVLYRWTAEQFFSITCLTTTHNFRCIIFGRRCQREFSKKNLAKDIQNFNAAEVDDIGYASSTVLSHKTIFIYISHFAAFFLMKRKRCPELRRNLANYILAARKITFSCRRFDSRLNENNEYSFGASKTRRKFD